MVFVIREFIREQDVNAHDERSHGRSVASAVVVEFRPRVSRVLHPRPKAWNAGIRPLRTAAAASTSLVA